MKKIKNQPSMFKFIFKHLESEIKNISHLEDFDPVSSIEWWMEFHLNNNFKKGVIIENFIDSNSRQSDPLLKANFL